MRYLRYFIVSICLIVAVGCSEEFTPTPYTYSKIFTGENNKTWKIKLFEQTLDGKVVDRFLPSCLTDDRYVFYANTEHSSQAISGTRKCFDEEADVTTSNWSFNNANATLIMVLPLFGDDPLPLILREADEDDMEGELFFDEAATESYRIHFEATDEE